MPRVGPLYDTAKPRKKGRPFFNKPILVPNNQDLALYEQDPGKQASSVRQDAYRFARLIGRNILIALRDDNKIGLKDSVIQWGISADKVLTGTESAGLTLTVPLALVDKLVLALQIKAQGTQVVDKVEKTS